MLFPFEDVRELVLFWLLLLLLATVAGTVVAHRRGAREGWRALALTWVVASVLAWVAPPVFTYVLLVYACSTGQGCL